MMKIPMRYEHAATRAQLRALPTILEGREFEPLSDHKMQIAPKACASTVSARSLPD